MEIVGRSDHDVDRVVSIDDLNVPTLTALVDRLEQTSHAEQFLFREVEMDDAYRQADADLKLALKASNRTKDVADLERIRERVFRAHDLVGLEQVTDAIKLLNSVIELKLGIDDSLRDAV